MDEFSIAELLKISDETVEVLAKEFTEMFLDTGYADMPDGIREIAERRKLSFNETGLLFMMFNQSLDLLKVK
jgi:hypothetical protein